MMNNCFIFICLFRQFFSACKDNTFFRYMQMILQKDRQKLTVIIIFIFLFSSSNRLPLLYPYYTLAYCFLWHDQILHLGNKKMQNAILQHFAFFTTWNFLIYSTVTDLARLRGWSTSQPLTTAI